MIKSIYAIIGILCLLLGSIGTFLPILPTVPFFIVSAYCFARSSSPLNRWFKQTKIYQNNLENFVNHRTMTLKTKIRIMAMMSLVMTIGFIIMQKQQIISGCIILICIWILHLLYFTFGIQTKYDLK